MNGLENGEDVDPVVLQEDMARSAFLNATFSYTVFPLLLKNITRNQTELLQLEI